MSVTINNSVVRPNEIKNHALISYLLLTLGLFTAIPMLFGAVWAMIKKRSSAGTMYYGHYANATRVFWWSLLWTVVGFVLMPVAIGFAVLGVAWLWALYRLVNGLSKILADEPYPL